MNKNLIIVLVLLGLLIYFFAMPKGALFNEPYTTYDYKLCAGSVIGFTGKDNCVVTNDVTITSWKTVIMLNASGGCTYTSVTADGIDVIVKNTCDQPPVECTVATDCEGKPHIECIGSWSCLSNICTWTCGIVPPSPQPMNLLDWIILSIRNFLCQYLHILC